MDKRDIAVIESAKNIREYCGEHRHCAGCVFCIDGTSCILNNPFVDAWELPKLKTYKQDFLDKFPDADFNADCICRKYVYPNSGEHPNCNNDKCEQCWNEAYITDRTEERSK